MWGADGFKTFKSIFGLARAAVPVLYCGYLAFYFFDVGGSAQGVEDSGLGPTVIGLGAVALLFSIPLALKAVRFFTGPRTPGPRSAGPRADENDDDDGGAAADAIIARYMARQAAETKAGAARAASKSGPAKPSFGRKL